ncbi:hypothetical protein [Reichenbachiella ulvae]|uniref:ABC transporter ATPase n=1 Tax=Reichenbachiella ulvae TaxID=2980104 RepID=A0ABT3CW96_9BACT|nr:hypothetical protein [Reichenbachiella ulvae]MCV9387963.1 hypothetical protein [Reichenbachiella ulvae]
MIVSFDELPGTARVWIYQADKTFGQADLEVIAEEANKFFDGWAAHGAPLKSSYKVFHDKFLVIAVDEQFNQASGCSIDASVGLVKTLEQKLGINFFDRSKVCFLVNDEIFESSLTEIKQLVEQGKIQSDTPTFNNLVPNKDELESSWIIPAEESWLKRYF